MNKRQQQLWLSLFLLPCMEIASCQPTYLQTVTGAISKKEMNYALIHEHATTNFIGANSVILPSEKKPAITTILPHLQTVKAAGVTTLFECTPSFIGKDVVLLQELSKQSGIHIITNTGLYAAVRQKYLPPYAYSENYKALAQRWIDDFKNGIDGTGIKPGFIKLGVNEGPIDSIETKLLLAAMETSKQTGLSIAVHTGDYQSALSQYQLASKQNFPLRKLIWVHAQNATNEQRKLLAEKGIWISLDGVSETTRQYYVDAILFLKQHKLLHRLLLSHDDGWTVLENGSYHQLELFGNGNKTPYSTIHRFILPELLIKGVTQKEIDQILRHNPIRCFGLKR
jgi:phosphotriesterase-related protein